MVYKLRKKAHYQFQEKGMGNFISNVLLKLKGNGRPRRLLLVGLDGAGKTTIINKLKFGETYHTVPTIGFNVETVEFKSLKFNVWDIGGQDNIRVLWKHFFQGSEGIIFVVDTSDPKRIMQCHREIHSLWESEDLKDCPLLVLANKMDIGIMSPQEIISKLELESFKGRNWYCQGCSALTGSGLFEGLNWLADRINEKK